MPTPTAGVPHKALFVLIDGVGDVNIPSLATSDAPLGRTPLQAARTPTLDTLASHGLCGLVDSVEVGQACGSDTAHLSLLGYDPLLFYRGRGAFEAIGSGLPMQTGDIAFKSNFAWMDTDPAAGSDAARTSGPRGVVRKRRADRSFQQWGLPLIEALDGLTLPSFPDVSVAVQHATEHRCGVRLRGPGLTDLVSGTDPLVDKRPLRTCTPTDGSAAATRTSAVINELSARIHEILSAHPLNLSRARAGLPIANIVLLRGAGARIAVRPFAEAQGLQGRALMVAPTAIIAGLGASVGFEVEKAPGATGDYHTDLLAKARLVVSRLRQQSFPPSSSSSSSSSVGPAPVAPRPFEFAFLHIKAVDDAGHDRDVTRKVEFIERSDEMLALVLRLLAEPGPGGPQDAAWSIVVTGDHSTPVRYGDHSVEPVPFVVAAVQHLPQFSAGLSTTTMTTSGHPSPLHAALASPRSQALRSLCTTHNPVRSFDEAACAAGLLGRFPGREVMPLLRNFRRQLLGMEADDPSVPVSVPAPAPAPAVPAPALHVPPAVQAPSPSSSSSSAGPPQLQSHLTQHAAGRILPLLPTCREGVSPWQEEVASQIDSFSPPPGTPFPSDTDVLIIGAGFTGLACAWELMRSRPRTRCVLLDRATIGSGATGRNGGHMHPVLPQEERDVLALMRQLQEAGVTPEQIDYRQKGGGGLERIDGASGGGGGGGGAFHSASYGAATLRPTAGSLHPMKLLLSIARILREQYSLPVWQHTLVSGVQRDETDPSLWRVVTPRGAVFARAVVHATNAWAARLLPVLDGLVVPVRNHLLLTTPVRSHLPSIAPTEPAAPLWDGQSLGWHEGYDYMIQRPDHRVVVGGHRYLAPRMDTAQADSQAPLLPYVMRSLQGLLPRTFGPVFGAAPAEPSANSSASANATASPNGDVGVSHAWSGILGFTPSCDPVIGGVPDAPGQFVAAGYSGHGMPRCHPAGRALAQMAVEWLERGMFQPAHIETDPIRRGSVPTQPTPTLLRMLDLTPTDLLRLQQQQQQQPTPRL